MAHDFPAGLVLAATPLGDFGDASARLVAALGTTAQDITDSIYRLTENCRAELDLDDERILARQEHSDPDDLACIGPQPEATKSAN